MIYKHEKNKNNKNKMKSNSQKNLLINNKSFNGLFEKEKNKNDYTKIDKQIDFSILP